MDGHIFFTAGCTSVLLYVPLSPFFLISKGFPGSPDGVFHVHDGSDSAHDPSLFVAEVDHEGEVLTAGLVSVIRVGH